MDIEKLKNLKIETYKKISLMSIGFCSVLLVIALIGSKADFAGEYIWYNVLAVISFVGFIAGIVFYIYFANLKICGICGKSKFIKRKKINDDKKVIIYRECANCRYVYKDEYNKDEVEE